MVMELQMQSDCLPHAPHFDRLREMAGTFRRWIIDQSFQSQVGHIGSALSIVDIIAALWGGVMRGAGTSAPDRDRFILSKGHASLALYCALRWNGIIDEATFHSYCTDGTQLGVHPEHHLSGIDLSTGSLGQGLSVASGLAFGLRQKAPGANVYAVISDAECNEGQTWEATMFAGHHRLANLTAVLDLNGSQALGPTESVLNLAPMADKWRGFGWNTVEVDGHDPVALYTTLAAPNANAPRLVIARTMLGKGIPFMENRVEWHYRTLTLPLRYEAIQALEAAE